MNGLREVSKHIRNPEFIKYPHYGWKKCLRCGGDLPKRKRRYCGKECQRIYLRTRSEYITIYWKEFRTKILRRDNYTCQECGQKAGAVEFILGLDVHHIIPVSKGGETFSPDNCVVLCVDCHHKKHRKRHLEPSLDEAQTHLEEYQEGT